MKAVILAGGRGTRISEETSVKPKPMVEIGGYPILWHIMKSYSHYGINEFIICCGYKGYLIKEYFANYFLHMSDVTFDMDKNTMEVHRRTAEPWKVTLVDTGENSNTGGRLRRVEKYLIDQDHFCFTYGDGVSDIDINKTIEFHITNKKYATLTSTNPPGRFGVLNVKNNCVLNFREKPTEQNALVNGGYFVLSKEVFKYINNDDTVWEQEPLTNLANDGQLMAYQHTGFWQPMDTLYDKNILEDLWKNGKAPWKKWV